METRILLVTPDDAVAALLPKDAAVTRFTGPVAAHEDIRAEWLKTLVAANRAGFLTARHTLADVIIVELALPGTPRWEEPVELKDDGDQRSLPFAMTVTKYLYQLTARYADLWACIERTGIPAVIFTRTDEGAFMDDLASAYLVRDRYIPVRFITPRDVEHTIEDALTGAARSWRDNPMTGHELAL